jgi:DNA polymerase-3 subunit epsilon
MRQIVLDTETTGMDPEAGHRIIEIGCVEVVNRRLTGNDLHIYINPEREIDPGALEVHGITQAFLADKPRFAEVGKRLAGYLAGAELIIHNAPFDLAFLNKELVDFDPAHEPLEDTGSVVDTLVAARRKFPGQRNSLDALCKRYEIDNSGRDLHGALLDAQLLADVYLRMTGGQIDIGLTAGDDESGRQLASADLTAYLDGNRRPLIQRASAAEQKAHEQYLDMLTRTSGDRCLWRHLES